VKLGHVAAALGLLCSAAYFTERLGLADLPGIPNDYLSLGIVAFAILLIVGRARNNDDTAGVHG